VPDVAALKSAARAAIVMPAVFAFADTVIAQPQTSIFAAFGSFAMLVLAEFGGPRRTRFLAYVGLACVGATFVMLGTLCSRSPWLAAAAMAAVGFATLFSGAFSGYFSAGHTAATPRAAAGFSRACAMLPAAATKQLSMLRWSCCGRASISTISGSSRPTSASAQTPPVRRRCTVDPYGS